LSIIYDALQKTQTVRQTPTIESPTKNKVVHSNKIFLLLLLAFSLCLSLFLYTHYYPHKKPSIPPAPLKIATPIAKHTPLKAPINLVLRGVFISDNEKVALINNKMLHVGDSYQGIKVLAIQLDKVKLKKDNFEFFLSQR